MSELLEPVIVQQTYKASIDDVWRAITDPQQMKQWFFVEMQDFHAEVGFETGFDVELEDVTYPHRWKVTEVVPESRLVYDWSYEGFAGDSFVQWELSESNGQTTLVLTHTVREPFPEDNPIFSRESGFAGWTYFLHESLKDFLEEDHP